jgi:hypothetical protein
MISKNVFHNPLALARTKTRDERHTCAVEGMTVVLNRYTTAAGAAGRLAGGFERIGPLVTALARAWRKGAAATGASDAAVEQVLSVAQECLKKTVADNTNPAIKPAVQALCWQLAWAYSTDYYRVQATQVSANRTIGGTATTMAEVVNANHEYGNPYDFVNSGFSYTARGPADFLYRGETRSPQDLWEAGGFTGRYLGTAQYDPWFNGASNGCTISFTSLAHVPTSLNAGGKAGETNSGCKFNLARAPVWLAAKIAALRPPDPDMEDRFRNKMRGYTYEVAPAKPSMRLTEQAAGTEECYLGVPRACITRFWVLLNDGYVAGPFPFDLATVVTGTMPAGGAISAARRQLP